MSSERDIEKLLREAAQQRLEKAGPPLELQPVNRRALQDEVVRQFGKKPHTAGPTFVVWLSRAWPRLAVRLGLVLILGMATTIWFQRNSRLRTENQTVAMTESRNSPGTVPGAFEGPSKDVNMDLALADNKAAEDRPGGVVETVREQSSAAGTAAMVPAPNQTPALAAAPPATRSAAVRLEKAAPSLAPTLAPAAGPPPLVASAPTAAVSAPQAATSAPEVFTYGGAAKYADGGQVMLRAGERLSALKMPDAKQANGSGRGLESAAATLSRATSAPVNAPFPLITQHFVQETAPATGRTVDALADGPAAPVLKAFDLKSSDGNLTITDADGSVYNGGMMPRVSVASSVSRSVGEQTNLAGAPQRIGIVTNWLFLVSGTNSSLNRVVVFEGSLYLSPAEKPAAESTISESDKVARFKNTAPESASIVTNFQIIGKAHWGGTSQIQVKARSMPPGR